MLPQPRELLLVWQKRPRGSQAKKYTLGPIGLNIFIYTQKNEKNLVKTQLIIMY